ncbi:MAG: hypothetical protein CMM37_06000 [Rhodospirillaceae bacterium]|nr:hypothetical protein [Rhodospirillaceae bacterium]
MRTLIYFSCCYFFLTSLIVNANDLKKIQLEYEVYIGGLRAITANLHNAFSEKTYDTTLNLQTEGITGKLFQWSFSAFSFGEIKQNKVIPRKAGRDSTWRGKKRSARLTFGKDGVPIVTLTPDPKMKIKEQIPSKKLVHTRDLTGALVSHLFRAAATKSCVRSERIFDGKRRYNLIFEGQVEEQLKRDQYSPYGGPTLRCQFRMEKIAGFRPKASRYKWMSDGSARIWLARVFPNTMIVPIRLEADTTFGGLFIYLVSATQIHRGKKTEIKRIQKTAK